jgi:N-terminal domain on NACHT_NTPase and P-loop NTPases
MAEALAAVGVVASIVQLVEFSSKILHRLDEFRSSAGEVPKSFRHIRAELPVLQDTLRQTKEAIDAGSVEDRTKKTLLPAIQGCQDQIEQLDAILAKTLPESSDSRRTRGKR